MTEIMLSADQVHKAMELKREYDEVVKHLKVLENYKIELQGEATRLGMILTDPVDTVIVKGTTPTKFANAVNWACD